MIDVPILRSVPAGTATISVDVGQPVTATLFKHDVHGDSCTVVD